MHIACRYWIAAPLHLMLIQVVLCHAPPNTASRTDDSLARIQHKRSSAILLHRQRNLRDRANTAIMKAHLAHLKHKKAFTESQRKTESNLKEELTRLVRRPRWTPPGPSANRELFNSQNQFQSNPVRYVQRSMQQLATTVNTLNENVQALSRWKSTTELRLERLEAALSSASRRISDHSHANMANQRNRVNSDRIDSIQSTVSQLQQDFNDLQTAVEDSNAQDESVALALRKSFIHPDLDSSSLNRRNLQGGHPIDLMDEVQNQAGRLDSHDILLRKSSIDTTSLQHHLMRIIAKNQRQDASIRFLQAICTNSSAVNSGSSTGRGNNRQFDVSPMAQPGKLKRIKDEMTSHSERIEELQRAVDNAGSCCNTVSALSDKTELMSERIHEARNRADESALAVRVNNRKVDEMTNKMDMQRLVIKRLQQTILNHQRSASRLNRNMQEGIRSRTSAINQTLFRHLQTELESLSRLDASSLADLQAHVTDNTNNLRATTEFVAQQMQQLMNTRFSIENLQHALNEHVMTAAGNDTRMSLRLDSNERMVLEAVSLVGETRQQTSDRTEAIEIRLSQLEDFKRNVDGFRSDPGRQDAMYESVIFLNSSYHQLRSAVHRQSNRYARLNSFVERLNQAESRIWERITRLQETADENNFRSNNASMSLRHMMTSDFRSLRHVVASRFGVLSHNIGDLTSSFEQVTSDQELLSQTLTSYAVDSKTMITEMSTKVNRVTMEQDTLGTRQNSLDQRLDGVLSSVNRSISELFLDRVEEITELDEHLQHQIGLLKLRTSMVERNVTEQRDRIARVQRKSSRLHRSLANTRANVLAVDDRMGSLEVHVAENVQKHQIVHNRLGAVDSSLREYGQVIVSNKMGLGIMNQAMENHRAAYASHRNSTRSSIKMLRSDHDDMRDTYEQSQNDINRKIDRVSEQLVSFQSDIREQLGEQNTRVVAVESLNSTLRAEITLCKDGVRQVEGGITELRQADSNLRETIELNARALGEHRKLHRNITALSDSVYDVINEQGEALDTVRNVVVQLNETLAEGKEHIDDAVSTQMQRHLREVKGLRFIMRNFTDIIQRVLSDRINQGVTMASVQIGQRGLIESIDNHAASIDRLNHDTARIRASMTAVEIAGEENTHQIGTLDLHLRSHERSLHQFDAMTYEMMEAINSINSSVAAQSSTSANLLRWMESDRELISDLAEMTTSLQEEFNENAMSVWESVNEIIQKQNLADDNANIRNATLEALEMWSAEAQTSMYQMNDNMNVLGARVDLIAGAIGSISELDRNVSEISRRVSELDRSSSENTRSSKAMRHMVDGTLESVVSLGAILESLQESNNLTHRTTYQLLGDLQGNVNSQSLKLNILRGEMSGIQTLVSERIDNVTQLSSELRLSVSEQRGHVDTLLGDRMSNRRDLEYLLSNVDIHDEAIRLLNASSGKLASGLTTLKQALTSRTIQIKNILSAAADDRQTLDVLQTKQWDHKSRIMEMEDRTSGVEQQVSTLDARLSRSLNKPTVEIDPQLQTKVDGLESELSQARSRITMLETEYDVTENVTQQLLGQVQENSLAMTRIGESQSPLNEQVMISLISSISALEQSLNEVNTSLTFSIRDILALLTDFQLAFDTSGRILEKYNSEMKIMETNFSNHIDYFTTSIDYLNQIVSATNQAVLENTQRIRVINETSLISQFTISSFLTGRADAEASGGNVTSQEGDDDSDYVVTEPIAAKSAQQPQALTGLEAYSIYQDEPGAIDYSDFGGDIWSNPANVELAAILNGDADDERIHRRTTSLLGESYEQEYGEPGDDYDDDGYYEP